MLAPPFPPSRPASTFSLYLSLAFSALPPGFLPFPLPTDAGKGGCKVTAATALPRFGPRGRQPPPPRFLRRNPGRRLSYAARSHGHHFPLRHYIVRTLSIAGKHLQGCPRPSAKTGPNSCTPNFPNFFFFVFDISFTPKSNRNPKPRKFGIAVRVVRKLRVNSYRDSAVYLLLPIFDSTFSNQLQSQQLNGESPFPFIFFR